MTSLLQDVAGLITTSVPSLVGGESLFAGEMPSGPDVAASIWLIPALPPRRSFGPGLPFSWRPRFAVRVRAPGYDEGLQLAVAVRDAIEPVVNEQVGTGFYLRMSATSDVMQIERDGNNRARFDCYFLAETGTA